MVDTSSSALPAYVNHLLNSLNESNSLTIFQVLSMHSKRGTDESILILRSCLDHLNVNGKDLKNLQLEPLYGLVFKYMLDRPNFITVLSESLRSMEIKADFLANLSSALHLALHEKVGFGLALLDSESPDVRMCGKNFCMAQIGELCDGHLSLDSAEQIHNILMFLHRSPGLAKHIDSFKQLLSLVDLKEGDQIILAPLLSDELNRSYFLSNLIGESCECDIDSFLEEMEKEISMANKIMEQGYKCTVTVPQCKEVLGLFSPLTEMTVAKILGTLARTHIGPEDNQFLSLTCNLSDMPSLNSWNTDVLVDSIIQLVPGINWIQVIENLDHEGFYFPNEEAFSFFMEVFRRACQDPFPLHAICGSVWKNEEGQISFLKYAVSVPPEVFTFAHSVRQLKYADVVHGHKSQLVHANHAWLSLDLLEVFCQLAEWGHANAVRSMLKQPLEQCPEVLLLGMAHVNTAYNLLQHEVSSTVFPKMLKSSLGSRMILDLWHVNPDILLRGFVDAYKIDPDNMGRTLDVCQELKILLSVLDLLPSYFGIRLAAVASRRELLDLEKWLSSKLIVYKDTFFEECLKFLKEVHSGASQDISSEFLNQSSSIWNHYSDTTPILMKVLEAHAGLIVSTQHLEEMGKLLATYMSTASEVKTGGSNDSTLFHGYAADIEEEANSCLRNMFSGELTVNVIIQMFARYKDSADKREQSLFECMIGFLFEEYRYFPEYPDKQLKIAAVLFGSLIKHQLITHLKLGIALRGVLDALCKSPDSKMYVFGTLALEQFVNRLIEWPQCCNHILQISHLRCTHPEVVASIERALADINSRQSESDVHSASAVQRQNIIQADSTNMEIPRSSSIPLTGFVSKPTGTQVLNPVRVDECQNLSVKSSSLMNPPASSVGQPSIVPSSDVSSAHKSPSTSLSAAPSSNGFSRPSQSTTTGRFGSALNIETLVSAAERRGSSLEAPASEIQDKVSFIINNLSTSNFEVKANDFAEILKEQYYPWFAQYMVMKRASIEPNFHDLYLKFLDKLSSRSLNKQIVETTYENCKVLLESELIKSSSEERSLLKNLGSWLGKITIGKNQVLRAREIDLKSLIIEAYKKGLMIAVIPFTSKILETCQSSKAFRPPNPFTMSIVGLLTEIYTMPNLKMNLKFDIEVLFKKLGIDMKDVTPTSFLKDKIRQVEENPDFSKDLSVSQKHLAGDVKMGVVSALNQVVLPLEVASPSHPNGDSNILSQLAPPLHLSSATLTEDDKLAALGLSHQLPAAQGLLQPPSPFSVSQISTAASGIDQQVVLNPKLHSLGLYLHFQSVVPIAMERAIKDTASGIVQRSVSIATQTTKRLVLKDYAMEVDETRIRNAAHLMVASLAGSLAHVTCKDPLRGSILSHLKNSLQGLNNASGLLEQAVQLVTNDNLDLGCALIEQSATEKAIHAIDVDIAQHLSIRRTQRESVGSAYFDSALYTQGYMSFLPEALRPKPGRLSHSQRRVYEDFVRLPWQNQSGHTSIALPANSSAFSIGAGLVQGFRTAPELLNSGIYSSGIGNTGVSAMPQPLDVVSEDIKTSPTQHDSAALPHDVAGDRNSLNFETDVVMVPFSPISDPESQSVEILTTVELASRPGSPQSLQQLVEVVRTPAANAATLSAVSLGVDSNRQAKDKTPGYSTSSMEDNNVLERVDTDPAGFRNQICELFAEWYMICDLPGVNDGAWAHYVLQLQQSGLLKGDETSDRFFHCLTEIAVSHCLSHEVVNSGPIQSPQQGNPLSFLGIDIYAKLVFAILKFSHADQGSNKASLLPKILAVTVRFIQRDAEDKSHLFNPRPYFRLFINWLVDLGSMKPIHDGSNFQVLSDFANAFDSLQPLEVPGFSFGWLELISHKSFMPKLLTGNSQRGWSHMQRLLVDLFQFLEPFLRNAELGGPVHVLYKGTLRVLLVLLHDFPEFLCDYHFSFCDVIPPSCIQMRHIILSAFPRNMRVPDPSTPNLKIDLLKEITQSPRILSEVDAALKNEQIKGDLDDYLKNKQQGSSFLTDLRQKLLLPQSDAGRTGTRYNIPLINSLVLYVGMQALQQLQAKYSHAETMASNVTSAMYLEGASLDIFQTLIMDLDTEGRYLFLNAIGNQLRYPNNHTHYFSFVMLYLFAESNQEIIQEQITRILLERLIVNRPHPWGLLVTFIELIKNPKYKFWSCSFVRCAPEIEKLFKSVSRSCGNSKPVNEEIVSGGLSEHLH